MSHTSFSMEAAMRRIVRIVPLLLIGFLAACSASDDLTGPGVPQAALAGVRSTPTPKASPSDHASSSAQQQVAQKEGKRRGSRYAMGAN